jgi:hypothetical protein
LVKKLARLAQLDPRRGELFGAAGAREKQH